MQLRLLSVENCGVGDRGLEVLRSLAALQSLDIRCAHLPFMNSANVV